MGGVLSKLRLWHVTVAASILGLFTRLNFKKRTPIRRTKGGEGWPTDFRRPCLQRLPTPPKPSTANSICVILQHPLLKTLISRQPLISDLLELLTMTLSSPRKRLVRSLDRYITALILSAPTSAGSSATGQ